MNPPKFSTEFPTSTIPVLPEYLKKNTPEGLAPGEIVYAYSYLIEADTETGRLYLGTKVGLDEDAYDPEPIGNRIGLMRIFEARGAEVVDGFIADMRHVEPGCIDSEIIQPQATATQEEVDYIVERASTRGLTPLLAAVFSDPDGKPHFMGDLQFMSHTQALMAAVDNRTRTESEEPEAQSDAEVTSDYYLG